MDIMQSLPLLVMALVMAAALGPSLENTIIAIAIPLVPTVARVVRGSFQGESRLEMALIGKTGQPQRRSRTYRQEPDPAGSPVASALRRRWRAPHTRNAMLRAVASSLVQSSGRDAGPRTAPFSTEL
jgi:hypothetical protein